MSFNMRSRTIRITITVVLLVISTVVTLWIAAPRIAAHEAIKKARALGVELQIRQQASTRDGYIFRHAVFSSSELPVEGSINEISVRMDGFTPISVTIHGVQATAIGSFSAAKEAVQLWRQKRPRTEGGKHTRIELTDSNLVWISPCGEGDMSIDGVQVSNEDGLHGQAASIYLKCRGWEAHGKSLRAGPGIAFEEVKMVRIREPLSPNKSDGKATRPNIVFPDVHVNAFKLEYDDQSVEATNLDLKLKATDSPELIASADSGSIDSPRFQTVTFGTSRADVNVHYDPFAFNVEAKLGNVRGQYKAVTGGEAEVDDIQMKIDGFFDQPKVRLGITRGDLKFKDVSMSVIGEWSPGGFSIDATLPKTDCQRLLEAVPDGMNNAIRGMVLTGNADATLHVSRKGYSNPDVKLRYDNRCKVSIVPDTMDRMALRGKFKRNVPGAHGGFVEIESGPGVKDRWVPYDDLSPFLIAAIQGTEDPGVLYHHGFIGGAIEQSIAEDITTGRFIRGASTVTMQLAKNIWLTREKTLSRKIQEAFLTTYLEQTLSKKEILETYFNVVEFGPMIYGIRDGAAYYFSVEPKDLTLAESIFLCSILPDPKVDRFDKDGNLTESASRIVQMIMRNMLDRNLITPAQYDAGSREILTQKKTILDYKKGDASPIKLTPGGLDPDWSH